MELTPISEEELQNFQRVVTRRETGIRPWIVNVTLECGHIDGRSREEFPDSPMVGDHESCCHCCLIERQANGIHESWDIS